ncbi:phosphopantetheine-binding protein [Photobacterium sanctipauli]|uniref:Phosphopantetheine-binding protein n=1 Tax=Photobacterium sanctipauli TaxID=1342794 RepID=A0A2T3NB37_9GAMM|nr:DUF6005 family protein [Photobacterium sanctipauli]PSW11050.1 phosphopantetheine-binding protein [Photobacterium sanctipauli]
MNYQQTVEAIKNVLQESMKSPHLASFHEQARLNEDLYLDSVQVLQLMLHLELDLGLKIPDDNIAKQDYETVASLARFLGRISDSHDGEHEAAYQSNEVASASTAQEEEFEDVKVHCFVSCVCEPLKRAGIDHRPFYFDVWDAEFTVTDNYQLCYHSDDIDHQGFRFWYKKLFGGELVAWYDPDKSKQQNLDTMMSLLATKPESTSLMVMLDMHHLPERENKFSQNPFPHYVLLKQTEHPDTLYMSDPDFRWEGELATERVANAIAQPTVAGGYYFDEQHLHPASDEAVKAYFDACFIPDRNPLPEAIREILSCHLQDDNDLALKDLSLALREIRVIAVRKYAYEHGFAFFWRALGLPDDDFEHWCDVIEDLVETYSKVQYQVMKLAQTQDTALATGIFALLDKQEATENRIKRRLQEAYIDWCEFTFAPVC